MEEPAEEEYFPAGQMVQLEEFAEEYCPAGHVIHAEEPAEYVPAGQTEPITIVSTEA